MPSDKPVKYLVFDNDGVNVDSEHMAMEVMDVFGYELVRKYRPDAALELGQIYAEFPGTSTDRIVDALIERYDLPEDKIRKDHEIPAGESVAIALADRITLATNKAFSVHLNTVPGITESLAALQSRYGAANMALCTTSREDRMDISLECAADPRTRQNAGLAAVFPKGDRRISGYGHNNKYELFFANSAWDPAETVVIEDSISGVSKAKAANAALRVVGTAAAIFYEDRDAQAKKLIDAGATIVITDASDLAKAVEWLDSGFDPAQSPSFSSTVYRAQPGARSLSAIPATPQPKI